jgi:hypothetical protein
MKAWKLWLFSAICFLFAGIMYLIGKKFFMGIMFVLLAGIYFSLSRSNYKSDNKAIQIELSDTDLENMNIELSKLIAEGEKIKAIKKYRMVTGLGLKEAKDYVDLLS